MAPKRRNYPQPFVEILQEACNGTRSKFRFELSQVVGNDKKRPLTCEGFLNEAFVGEGRDEKSGRAARNQCAQKIIDSIFRSEIVVEDALYQKLLDSFPLYVYPKTPPLPITVYAKPLMERQAVEPYFIEQKAGNKKLAWRIPKMTFGCMMLRKMGWTGMEGFGTSFRVWVVAWPGLMIERGEDIDVFMFMDYQGNITEHKYMNMPPLKFFKRALLPGGTGGAEA